MLGLFSLPDTQTRTSWGLQWSCVLQCFVVFFCFFFFFFFFGCFFFCCFFCFFLGGVGVLFHVSFTHKKKGRLCKGKHRCLGSFHCRIRKQERRGVCSGAAFCSVLLFCFVFVLFLFFCGVFLLVVLFVFLLFV